jgi:hypothetical protein
MDTVRRLVVIAALAAFGAIGCADVKPYQRGTLAHPAMRKDARPEEDQARTHMLGARESSQGGTGEAGGGCGCN